METLLNWLAPACIILGALLTASNLGNRITGVGFIALAAGSLAWMGLGLLGGPPSLIWQNIILALLNGFGVWRWLGREAQVEEGAKAAQEGSRTSQGESLFPASMLGKAAIQNDDGDVIGAAVDAMIGCGSGRVSYLVLSRCGIAGVAETLHRLDWHEMRIDGEQITAHISSPRQLPEMERDQWPSR